MRKDNLGRPTSLPVATRLLALAGMALIIPGCGGGGSSGGSSAVDLDGLLLDHYAWTITNPSAAGPAFSHTRIFPDRPQDTYIVDAGTGSIHGNVERSSQRITFNPPTVFSVDWIEGGPEPAQFTVAVMNFGEFQLGTLWPESGSYAVTWGDHSIFVSHGTQITLQLDDQDPVSLSTSALLSIDTSANAPDWQRVAARSARALTEMLERASGAMNFIEQLHDGELDTGLRVRSCEAFPGNPPPGIQVQGESVVIQLGPGIWESIGADCLSLFQSGPSPGTRGVLASASLLYRNLQVTIDPAGTITSAGFVPASGTAGGLLFDNARLRGVSESSPGSLEWIFSGEEQRRDGGFAISFSQP